MSESENELGRVPIIMGHEGEEAPKENLYWLSETDILTHERKRVLVFLLF